MRKTAPIEINPSLLGFGPGYADEAWEQLLTDEAVEATDVFKAFRRQVEKLSGGAKLSARFETG